MNSFFMKIYAASGDKDVDFRSINDVMYRGRGLLDYACDYINRSGSFIRYGRSVQIVEVTESYIFVKLVSREKLTMPAKSMSGFSRRLIQLDEEIYPDEEERVFKRCMQGGALFRYVIVSEVAKQKGKVSSCEIHEKKLSDLEALKKCVELFYGSESIEYAKREEAKEKIKAILEDLA